MAVEQYKPLSKHILVPRFGMEAYLASPESTPERVDADAHAIHVLELVASHALSVWEQERRDFSRFLSALAKQESTMYRYLSVLNTYGKNGPQIAMGCRLDDYASGTELVVCDNLRFRRQTPVTAAKVTKGDTIEAEGYKSIQITPISDIWSLATGPDGFTDPQAVHEFFEQVQEGGELPLVRNQYPFPGTFLRGYTATFRFVGEKA